MLWRLPTTIRSFPGISSYRKYTSVAKSADPLRILFCGSDNFSIASLRALAKAQQDTPDLIASIDVVHRPPKPTGRGKKILLPVPIQRVATEELHLNTHVIDTFTGWTPPIPIDIVIAVSFGLLVPPRILGLAKYGGLNVHASLLPDLHGPAPIQHALLKERRFTGVSIQTLHPKHFDRGTVLAQTDAPGTSISRSATTEELTRTLADEGAKMLVDVLRSKAFVPPLLDAGWYGRTSGPVEHAPKLNKDHQRVDFQRDGVEDILKIARVLGPPYCILPNGSRLRLDEVDQPPYKLYADGFLQRWDYAEDDARLIWSTAFLDEDDTTSIEGKGHVTFGYDETHGSLVVLLGTGEALRVNKSTYEGGKTGHGNSRVLQLILGEQV